MHMTLLLFVSGRASDRRLTQLSLVKADEDRSM